MMKIANVLVVSVSLALGIPAAFAHGKGDVKKAEAKMMSACKKEYPDAVKGKKFKEVADWVESEEHGANAEKFKKSDCYKLHEDWEAAAGQGEEQEKKD
ncbi:MAG: hypothetical protein ACXVBW_05025 [Bdellovibrionota bacterium]